MPCRALTGEQWQRIAPLLPAKTSDLGRVGRDNGSFVVAVLWRARHGAAWRALPDEFGPWNSAFAHFRRWARAGVWGWVFADLSREADFAHAIIDGTIVRVHAQANDGPRAEKRGLRVRPSARAEAA